MNRSGELAESEDPKPENNDSSNSGMDSASSGSPPSLPVSASVNAEGEVPKLGTNDPSKALSGSGAADGLSSSAPVSPNLNPPEDKTKKLSVIKPRATGPRTERGKATSKRNALKHGIFAEVILLPFERQNQFSALLQGLRNTLKPVGLLEETLVEKLAVTLWRYRRLLQAETGQLTKRIQKAESDLQFPHSTDSRAYAEDSEYGLDTLIAIADKHGLIPSIADPGYLEVCLDKLQDVRRKADCFGLTEDSIPKLLRRVYGARYEGRPGEDLFDLFSRYKPLLQAQLDRQTLEGIKDHTNYGELFIKEVDKEIARLEHQRNYPVSRKFSDSPDDYSFRIYGHELLRLMIPSDSHSDRLLRYEASLERAFDRTLNQLERIQRMRKGQMVPAPISVNVTAS